MRRRSRPPPRRASDTPELFIAAWALSELIEAADQDRQRRARARMPFARLGEHTEASDTDWALGIHARVARAARRGRGRRALVPRGDRAAGAHAAPAGARSQRTCSTGSGCAARTGASTPASSCARRTMRSWRSAWRRSPSAPAASWSRPARRCAAADAETRDELTPQEEQIARLARRRTARTRRSARSCSSVRAPSSGTCARSSPSSRSTPAGSSARRCPSTDLSRA